jgi:hypothetical protein
MADDRVQRLGDHHRQLGILVDAVEQQRQAVGGQKQAVLLVVGPVDRHAGVVEEAGGGEHDLGVARAHPVLRHHRRLDAAAVEEPEQPQSDVHDDLYVDPGVVRHVAPVGVHLRHVPPCVQAPVAVGRREQGLQLAVAARGGADLGHRHIHAGYPSTR